MPEFYIIIARKIFFPNFRGARALNARVSDAYAANKTTSNIAVVIAQPESWY